MIVGKISEEISFTSRVEACSFRCRHAYLIEIRNRNLVLNTKYGYNSDVQQVKKLRIFETSRIRSSSEILTNAAFTSIVTENRSGGRLSLKKKRNRHSAAKVSGL